MPTSARPAAQKVFDYTSLDAETFQFVQQQTGEIRVLMKRTAQGIVEIGQKLIEVKEKLGYGRFGDWLEAEFEWGEWTAQKFMQVAQQFGGVKFTEIQIAPSALYELAAPSTPEAARTEAIARAKAGEPITYTAAKEIKKRYALPAKKSKSGPKPEPTLELELEAETVSHPKPLQTTPPLPLSGTKLEIVAIRPQAQTSALETATRLVVPQAIQTPLASQPLVEQPGVWWELGGKHLLYCGDPNSSEFMGQIIEEVPLLLVFRPSPGWQSAIPAKTCIITSDYLPQGKNLDQLDEILEASILFYSCLQNIVVSCFLPSPEILTVVNRQGRRGLFAEPDERRCKIAIANWKKAGLKVERLD